MEDFIYKFKKYYDKSGPLKTVLGTVYRQIPLSLRYGKVYRYYRDLLKESQSWAKEKLEEYQLQGLKKLITHAYENVPYYRRIFDEKGLKPKDIRTLSDIQKIPFLTKEVVRKNPKDLIAKNYSPHRLLYQTTGGSTGSPLIFYHEKGVGRSKETAFFESMWSRVGYRWWKNRMVSLRGERIGHKDKFWEYEPIRNNLILSVYHMTEENQLEYIKKIDEFKPDFFYAYPSAITILAGFMKKNNITLSNKLKAVLCGSEHLFPYQQQLIQDVFKCKILNWYGMGEKVILAGSCEKSSYYHIFPEYGITELIGKDDKPVTQEGQAGEIVGTVFDNDIMPFIRYKTQDIGTYTCEKCSCGRNYPLLKNVEGRIQEFIVSRDNNLVALNGLMVSLDADVFSESNENWKRLKQFQFVQQEKGKIILKVIKSDDFPLTDAKKYTEELFKSRFDPICDFEIEFVDDIQKTERGKHKFLIQNLDISKYQK